MALSPTSSIANCLMVLYWNTSIKHFAAEENGGDEAIESIIMPNSMIGILFNLSTFVFIVKSKYEYKADNKIFFCCNAL